MSTSKSNSDNPTGGKISLSDLAAWAGVIIGILVFGYGVDRDRRQDARIEEQERRETEREEAQERRQAEREVADKKWKDETLLVMKAQEERLLASEGRLTGTSRCNLRFVEYLDQGEKDLRFHKGVGKVEKVDGVVMVQAFYFGPEGTIEDIPSLTVRNDGPQVVDSIKFLSVCSSHPGLSPYLTRLWALRVDQVFCEEIALQRKLHPGESATVPITLTTMQCLRQASEVMKEDEKFPTRKDGTDGNLWGCFISTRIYARAVGGSGYDEETGGVTVRISAFFYPSRFNQESVPGMIEKLKQTKSLITVEKK